MSIFIDYSPKIYGHNKYLVVLLTSNGKKDFDKLFKTKSAALKFAKSYMRKH